MFLAERTGLTLLSSISTDSTKLPLKHIFIFALFVLLTYLFRIKTIAHAGATFLAEIVILPLR